MEYYFEVLYISLVGRAATFCECFNFPYGPAHRKYIGMCSVIKLIITSLFVDAMPCS